MKIIIADTIPTTCQRVVVSLPYAPGANTYWRMVGGRMILSAAARAYRKDVARILAGHVPFSGDVEIVVDVYRPIKSGDLDGRLKQLLDALQGHLYHDDKQIVRINAARYDDKLNPRIEVQVTQALAAAKGGTRTAITGD